MVDYSNFDATIYSINGYNGWVPYSATWSKNEFHPWTSYHVDDAVTQSLMECDQSGSCNWDEATLQNFAFFVPPDPEFLVPIAPWSNYNPVRSGQFLDCMSSMSYTSPEQLGLMNSSCGYDYAPSYNPASGIQEFVFNQMFNLATYSKVVSKASADNTPQYISNNEAKDITDLIYSDDEKEILALLLVQILSSAASAYNNMDDATSNFADADNYWSSLSDNMGAFSPKPTSQNLCQNYADTFTYL